MRTARAPIVGTMRWTGRIRHPRATRDAGASTALLTREEPWSGGDTLPPERAVPTEPAWPADVPVGCRVVVVGPVGMLRSLAAALPPTWAVEHVDEVGDLTVADLVVLAAPTPGKVAAVLARQPDASVLALTHPAASVDAVVELLGSGAAACVRTVEPELVAAHLVACARRYPLGAG